MDKNSDEEITIKFLNHEQIEAVYNIIEDTLLSNDELTSKGILSNGFLNKLSDHNDKHKVDIKNVLEESKYNFTYDNNSKTYNIVGYPRGNFIYLFTHNLLLCLKEKRFLFKFIQFPLFKVVFLVN